MSELFASTGNNRNILRLYKSLLDPNQFRLNTPEDIRFVYNQMIYNESDPTTFIDGDLFRSNSVFITSNNGEILHKGLEPESIIHAYLTTLLHYLNYNNSAKLYKIPIAHYIFGFVHPFYDGNGRIARFISSFLLNRELELLTALSLSQSIEKHRDKYYSAFDISNHPLNRGELTFFCINFFEIIKDGQINIILDCCKKLTVDESRLKLFL